MTIVNAKDLPVGSPHLPQMSEAFDGLMQPTTLWQVTKTLLKTGEVYESRNALTFEGVFAPMKPFQIMLKPEGQRDWKWFTIHAKRNLALKIDDIIYYLKVKYRIVSIWDYSQYGYFTYDAVQDFSDTVNPPPLPNQSFLNKFLLDVVITSPLYAILTTAPAIPDATKAKWAVYSPSGQKIDVPGTVQILSVTQVRITVPAPGTYRVIGES